MDTPDDKTISPSDMKDLKSVVDKKLKTKFPEDEFTGISTKIWATGKWIFERGADPTPSPFLQKEEYKRSEEECHSFFEEMSLKERLSFLTEKQAKLFWYFKGSPKIQSPEQEKDDYYNAKRYIGFLLAESLLKVCTNRSKKCATIYLQADFVEYLQSITVEEYLRFKAYLKWHTRNNDTLIHKDNGKDKVDYFNSLNYLDNTMINCKEKECNENLPFWLTFLNNYKTMNKAEVISHIANAKLNSLKRLTPSYNEMQIHKFVNNYYGDYVEWIEQKGERQNTNTLENIVQSIYSQPYAINMLEYISKCPILCQIARDIHNNYRQKTGKVIVNINSREV